MSLDKAREYIKKFNLDNKISVHDELISTVSMASEQIGCSEGQIAKSLAFKIKDEAIIVVMAGDKKIDNRKFKDEFKIKAKMLTPEETLEKIGHEVGGVCPFGIKEGVKVYLDNSLKDYDKVHPACGSKNSSIELTIEELETLSNYIAWVDISK
ncbi:YbaK/EbsC family protein [Miniphocaeibacter halophilus]|uniref:YbaK/EbsC family protein n=1 Tax=Miniphocaeibacter halophilus TaxID=2931922 RepID=A0AC61MPH7_9FIRM|nr:YbaK/EbsC family protein [Miniphocaeibacter halophilus]QQK07416.1 YbaK/EbsC family protein [Miniphocaeibacter halophilus]